MLRAQSILRLASPALLLSFLAAGCGDSATPSDAAVAPDVPAASPDAAPGSDAPAAVGDVGAVDTATLTDALQAGPEIGRTDSVAAAPFDGGAGPDAGPSADAMGTPPPDGGADAVSSEQSTATIVVLPDTQYYALTYPDVFNGQTDWIVAQKAALNIAAVLHVGDIVEHDAYANEWTVANPAMRVLDKVVPYVVVPGNHDYSTAARASAIDNYFSPASMPWISCTMKPGQIENSYALIDIGPQKWLVLGLEFAPRDSVINWANTVLRTYANYPAILVTHLYLYSDGTRYNINVGGSDPNATTYQYWNPQYYSYSASEGINDGEAMWQKLVVPNPNVKLVFCGHQTGWAHATSTRPDGTHVHEILSDYQWLAGANFGYGYLRVVQLDYQKKTIQVQTYSPYLSLYSSQDPNNFSQTNPDNPFVLDLNL